MTRAFVAVVPPDRVLDEIAGLSAALDLADVRRTTRAQWHVTLQFLGNRADVDAVGAALEGLPATTVSGAARGWRCVPEAAARPRALAGLPRRCGSGAGVAREVGVRLASLGHAPRAREFRPHLTLARAKDADRLHARRRDDRARTLALPAWTVAELVVFESVLRAGGAQYVPRAAIALRG